MAFKVETINGIYYLNEGSKKKKNGEWIKIYYFSRDERKKTGIDTIPEGFELGFRGEKQSFPVIRKIRPKEDDSVDPDHSLQVDEN